MGFRVLGFRASGLQLHCEDCLEDKGVTMSLESRVSGLPVCEVSSSALRSSLHVRRPSFHLSAGRCVVRSTEVLNFWDNL